MVYLVKYKNNLYELSMGTGDLNSTFKRKWLPKNKMTAATVSAAYGQTKFWLLKCNRC
jgi:hypothetical protein